MDLDLDPSCKANQDVLTVLEGNCHLIAGTIQLNDTDQDQTASERTKRYSRTSVARTLMARLPLLFRTHS